MIELRISKKTKRKARRRRERGEKKWRVLRLVMLLSIAISILSFGIAIFWVPSDEYGMLFLLIAIFAVLLVGGFVIKGLLINFTSHWIQDRLNERMWIETDVVYHFVQIAFAAGLNCRNADASAYLYEYNIWSITDAKYDSKSGRIEFKADGKVTYYKNYYRKIVEKEREYRAMPVVCYEYMTPSLYDYLVEQGIVFELTTLDFKVRDPHI